MCIKLGYASSKADAHFHLDDPIIADIRLFHALSINKIYNRNSTDVIYVSFGKSTNRSGQEVRLNETLN